ncbi:MAG: hypothetical protein OWQ54_02775 [Sulfolobaceae archaeon]|nr:hypothetical protein [Sulfolobaceae archaeon]
MEKFKLLIILLTLAILVNVTVGYVMVKSIIVSPHTTQLPTVSLSKPFSIQYSYVLDIKEDRVYYIEVNEINNPNITDVKVLVVIYKGDREISSFVVSPNEPYMLALKHGRYMLYVYISGYSNLSTTQFNKYFSVDIYYLKGH